MPERGPPFHYRETVVLLQKAGREQEVSAKAAVRFYCYFVS